MSAVGEYAGGYGFPLPNPVSMYREYPRSRLWIEWCMQTLQKNEATWYGVLRHYDAGFDTALRVFEGQWNRWDSIQCYATFNRWNDKRKVNVNRNDNDWNDNWWFAGVRNSLHFSPYFLGEFCFVSWPFHPPSILPISSSITDRVIYFLSSKDFVSQRIMRSTRKVSAFLIANRTYGCFSSRDKKLAAEIASITSTNKVSIRWPRECLCVFGISW